MSSHDPFDRVPLFSEREVIDTADPLKRLLRMMVQRQGWTHLVLYRRIREHVDSHLVHTDNQSRHQLSLQAISHLTSETPMTWDLFCLILEHRLGMRLTSLSVGVSEVRRRSDDITHDVSYQLLRTQLP